MPTGPIHQENMIILRITGGLLWLSPLCRWRNWGSEQLDFLEFPQVVKGFKAWFAWPQSPCWYDKAMLNWRGWETAWGAWEAPQGDEAQLRCVWWTDTTGCMRPHCPGVYRLHRPLTLRRSILPRMGYWLQGLYVWLSKPALPTESLCWWKAAISHVRHSVRRGSGPRGCGDLCFLFVFVNSQEAFPVYVGPFISALAIETLLILKLNEYCY